MGGFWSAAAADVKDADSEDIDIVMLLCGAVTVAMLLRATMCPAWYLTASPMSRIIVCKSAGACPARPKVIPRKEWKLKKWSGAPEPDTQCQKDWKAGKKPSGTIKKVTWGLLTHEPRSFKDSMDTYEKLGMFEVMDEFLIYINKRRPEVDAVAESFRAKYPAKIKVCVADDAHRDVSHVSRRFTAVLRCCVPTHDC